MALAAPLAALSTSQPSQPAARQSTVPRGQVRSGRIGMDAVEGRNEDCPPKNTYCICLLVCRLLARLRIHPIFGEDFKHLYKHMEVYCSFGP